MFAKVRHGDKAALAADLRDIFRTGQRDYTMETAWSKWQDMCERWGKDYLSIKRLRDNSDSKPISRISTMLQKFSEWYTLPTGLSA